MAHARLLTSFRSLGLAGGEVRRHPSSGEGLVVEGELVEESAVLLEPPAHETVRAAVWEPSYVPVHAPARDSATRR